MIGPPKFGVPSSLAARVFRSDLHYSTVTPAAAVIFWCVQSAGPSEHERARSRKSQRGDAPMTDPLTTRRWTRRDFLQTSGAVAAGAYGMRWGLGLAADIPTEFDGSKFQLAAPEPNPKHGGVLRMGIPLRPPHFDVHQSGTIFNLGSRGYFVDIRIGLTPHKGEKTITPHLAHRGEIGKPAKPTTFPLR